MSHSLLSGKRVGGQTALEMGLVNRAVEQNQTGDAAYREALSLAREILPQVGIQTHFFSLCYSSDSHASLFFFLQARTCSLTSSFFSSALFQQYSLLSLLCTSFHSAFLPSFLCLLPTFSSLPHPSSLPFSSGLCRSVFLSVQFRCPQLPRPGWQSSGGIDHK